MKRTIIKWSNLNLINSDGGLVVDANPTDEWLVKQKQLLSRSTFDRKMLILVDGFTQKVYGVEDLTPYQQFKDVYQKEFGNMGIEILLESELIKGIEVSNIVFSAGSIKKEIQNRKLMISKLGIDLEADTYMAIQVLKEFARESIFMNQLSKSEKVFCLINTGELFEKCSYFKRKFKFKYGLIKY